jgi:hypothetical protein
VTLRLRLSLAFLLVVIVPLLVAAIVVGRGLPRALDDSADNRIAAARAGAVSFLRQECDAVRLSAEVLAREAAASFPPAATGDAAAAAAAEDAGWPTTPS